MISLSKILRQIKEESDPQSGKAAQHGSGYKPVKELVTDTEVICDNCDWSWEIADGGNKPFLCHKCGYDNTPKNLNEKCWDGYRKDPNKPMKKGKKGNMVPNCVKVREEKKGPKLNPAYLTKDAAQMKKDIEKRKSLKSDDPAAYEKWDADYIDKAKTKKYKTRKSTSTTAYEKRFGKKEK
jgi:hypothetical protein